MENNKRMVQYAVWPNCNNNCKFCLRKERVFYTEEQQICAIKAIRKNIRTIDWKQFPYGISLLGGEIYNIENKMLQNEFLKLIDDIIDVILINKELPKSRYSSVTNGIYDNRFLFKVIDKIKDAIGLEKLDLNFSYDIKYRYKSENDRKKVLENVNAVHTRYNYRVGVQMILTSYLIRSIKKKKFDINHFLLDDIPGNMLSLLYPHKIHSGYILNDFQFTRKDFLWFLNYLRNENYGTYLNFVYSTRNSSTFKYTGLKQRKMLSNIDYNQQPILSDGKECLNNNCGHSTLYQCYADSDKCLLCDILAIDNTIKS